MKSWNISKNAAVIKPSRGRFELRKSTLTRMGGEWFATFNPTSNGSRERAASYVKLNRSEKKIFMAADFLTNQKRKEIYENETR